MCWLAPRGYHRPHHGRGEHLEPILDALEAHYGVQVPQAPADPYPFLVWWHCGYPPSEERCARGWQAVREAVGIHPGLLRAQRLKDIAARVLDDLGGDLPRRTLARLPTSEAHALVRTFPGIGPPGADRILLFAGLAPLAAVPSSCPQVPVRIESGRDRDYRASYAQAQRALASSLPATLGARQRAYLLLLRHGRELCRRSLPRCGRCPLATQCRFNRAADRRKSAPRSRR